MRIALIAQFYPPEPCAAANRVVALARALAAAGHDVVVYTALPSFPSGIIDAAYRGRRGATEIDGRIRVERVWTYAGRPSWPGNRLGNWLSVAAGIALRVLVARRFDAIVVSSPPITLALPALVAHARHRAPLVVDIRDVFPEVAVKMGAWKAGSRIARAVGAVADTLYTRAQFVVCVTETARTEIAARGVPAAKIVLAPNGFDEIVAAAEPLFPDSQTLDVVYVGNMGLATGLDVVLDGAAALRGDPRFRFVLIGGGADEARLRERVANEGLTNVIFAGVRPRAQAQRALEDAFATVVPLKATIVDSLPTKCFDAMLAGCPIVLAAEGEARRLVERAGAGIAVPPTDGAALAAALVALAGDPDRRARYARDGQTFVRANYDRAAVMGTLAARVGTLSAR